MTGLRMVVTGVLEFMERNQAEDLVKLYGGKTQNNPAGNTDYVVAGREPGPKKMEKAAALGVPVLTETEFCTMIETRTAADAAEESPAAQRKRSKRRATTSIGGTSKQSKF
jgi:BRCT domain type II-containing protein